MNWLRRIVALVLLALWLPATSHCALVTMLDWLDDHCAASCTHACPTPAEHDHAPNDACATLEGGAIKPAVASLVAPSPTLTTLACLARVHACLLARAEAVAPPAWSENHPDAWVPFRHLAVRAVAPARAPGLI